MGLTAARARRRRDTAAGLAFTLPALAHTLVFMLIPAAAALYFSFTEWDMVGAPRWIGLDNYRDLLLDHERYPDFLTSVRVTLVYTVLAVPASLLTGFVQAYLIDQVRRGQSAFRLVFYLPMVTAEAAVAAVWKWLYDPQFGLINWVLAGFGVTGPDWLGTPELVVPAMAVIAAWQSGTAMLIFLAGLKGVPREYYEAAEVDGANRWQRLIRITLPLLRPTTFYLVVTTTIFALQLFGIVFVLFRGGVSPEHSGLSYVLHLYLYGYRNGEMGAACAMSFLLFVTILIVTWAQFRLARRGAEE